MCREDPWALALALDLQRLQRLSATRLAPSVSGSANGLGLGVVALGGWECQILYQFASSLVVPRRLAEDPQLDPGGNNTNAHHSIDPQFNRP